MKLPMPYYSEPGITIYHGDCRDILPHLEPVDLVLTDPPYGIKLENHSPGKYRRAESYKITGDDSRDASIYCLAKCESDKIPTIVFCHPKLPWPGTWRQYLVWDKGPAVGGGGDIKKCWKQSWELIQIARLKNLNGSRDEAVLKYWINPDDLTYHIAEKPLRLINYLIMKSTRENETILDPFMGSGTTLRAAKDLGRKAIGIEIEQKYCDIAIERLRQGVLL